jgi:Cu/Ag efflux protein CusF
MQRLQKIYVVVGLLAAPVLTGTAAAQAPQQKEEKPATPREKKPATTEVTAMKASKTATVEKINQPNRELTLKGSDGNEFKVTVPETVTRFDAIRKGDSITLDYYTSVALSLKKGGTGQPPSASEQQTISRTPGALPGGVMARRVDASAEVVKVDTTAHKVTLKSPSGDVDTIEVTDPELRADLAKLKPGDKIQAVYTEAVAISVQPKAKAG